MTYTLKPISDASDVSAPQDGLSWNALAGELRSSLIRVAVKLVWNRDDAEEIVQEAFRLALTKQIDPQEGRFCPWMYRTVANLCLNHRRRYKAEPIAEWMEQSHGEGPAELAERSESLSRLRRAIASLPKRRRLAVTLRLLERMEYRQIAEIMRLSVSAVRAHVHQARAKLLMQLTERKKGGEP